MGSEEELLQWLLKTHRKMGFEKDQTLLFFRYQLNAGTIPLIFCCCFFFTQKGIERLPSELWKNEGITGISFKFDKRRPSDGDAIRVRYTHVLWLRRYFSKLLYCPRRIFQSRLVHSLYRWGFEISDLFVWWGWGWGVYNHCTTWKHFLS